LASLLYDKGIQQLSDYLHMTQTQPPEMATGESVSAASPDYWTMRLGRAGRVAVLHSFRVSSPVVVLRLGALIALIALVTTQRSLAG